MKKNVTYVAQEKFLAVAQDLGINVTEQAGFLKFAGPRGYNVYVAKTKNVGRVDLSGFTVAGEKDLGGESFGNVHQQLLFEGRSEEQILEAFRNVVNTMKSLPALEKPARKSMTPKAPKASKVEEAPADPKATRRKAIVDRAQAIMAFKHISLSDALSEAQAEQDAKS